MLSGDRPLRRMLEPKAKLAGVCSGIAYGFGISVLMVRLIFVALTCASAPLGIILYMIAAFTMESWNEVPEDYDEVTTS